MSARTGKIRQSLAGDENTLVQEIANPVGGNRVEEFQGQEPGVSLRMSGLIHRLAAQAAMNALATENSAGKARHGRGKGHGGTAGQGTVEAVGRHAVNEDGLDVFLDIIRGKSRQGDKEGQEGDGVPQGKKDAVLQQGGKTRQQLRRQG